MKVILAVLFLFSSISAFANSSYDKGFEEGKKSCETNFIKCDVNFIMWEEDTQHSVNGNMTHAQGIEKLLKTCNNFYSSGEEACRKAILAGKAVCKTLY